MKQHESKARSGHLFTATQRALLCLRDGGWHGLSASEVGSGVWPDRERRPGRGMSINGGGDYAAQMLLGRIKKAGLVEYASGEGSTRWRLSTKGQNEVRALESKTTRHGGSAIGDSSDRGRLSTAGQGEDCTLEPTTHGGGTLVASSNPCTCGCAPEEHGRDPKYPGSTQCTACEDCIAYEADPEAA